MTGLRTSKRFHIATFLLLAIAARSMIAAGWMLHLGESGSLGDVALVICPQQNPELVEHLNQEQNGHHHHHGDEKSGEGLSFSVDDSNCGLWTASKLLALGVTAIAAIQGKVDFTETAHVSLAHAVAVNRNNPSRAPPVILS